MRLSVIVPATDAPPSLETCLDAVRASGRKPDEVIVIDSPATLGAGAARNEGARRATGDIHVFVDADVVVDTEALGRIAAHFEADPGLAAVFGAYDDRVRTRFVGGFRNLLHHETHRRSAGASNSFWAGLGAVRREAFEAVGGFDPRLSAIEDIELGGRLARRGRVLLDPAITGTHLKDWTLLSMVTTDFGTRGVPWVRLIASRRSVPRSLSLGRLERASALAAVAVAAGAAGRSPRLALGGAGSLLVLNRSFYRLLYRRLGTKGAVLGPPLHALHLLTCVAAVPVGLGAWGIERVRRPARRPRGSGYEPAGTGSGACSMPLSEL